MQTRRNSLVPDASGVRFTFLMSSSAHPVPFPLNDPSRGFSRQPLRSGPFSGMDHPTPPSPNSRASSPVLYDQHLVSDLSAVSQASELAVTKRAEEDARHAQALSLVYLLCWSRVQRIDVATIVPMRTVSLRSRPDPHDWASSLLLQGA